MTPLLALLLLSLTGDWQVELQQGTQLLKQKQYAEARKHLAKNTLTPDNVVDTVPMLGYVMTKDMSPKQLGYLQSFADFGTKIGVVPEKLDVKTVLKAF